MDSCPIAAFILTTTTFASENKPLRDNRKETNMPTPEITNLVTDLRTLLVRESVKPNTVKSRLVESAFIAGVASAKGGAHRLPPAVLLCAMSGRSILTLDEPVAAQPTKENLPS